MLTRKTIGASEADPAAGNGILSRRIFLEGALVAGVAGAGLSGASAEPLAVQSWMKVPGAGFAPYGQPSRFEDKVVRAIAPPANPATQGVGVARTPLHLLEGVMTPSGLHFERSHSGIPDIDPDQHRLVIHGLVRQPLVFTVEALSRYPMQSRIAFIECAGNSQVLNAPQPQPLNATGIHGLLGCSEWSGVRLATLLDEAGVDPAARWVIAEGADFVRHEPQHSAGQGDGRRAGLSLPERRTGASVERLSDAAVAARL